MRRVVQRQVVANDVGEGRRGLLVWRVVHCEVIALTAATRVRVGARGLLVWRVIQCQVIALTPFIYDM